MENVRFGHQTFFSHTVQVPPAVSQACLADRGTHQQLAVENGETEIKRYCSVVENNLASKQHRQGAPTTVLMREFLV